MSVVGQTREDVYLSLSRYSFTIFHADSRHIDCESHLKKNKRVKLKIRRFLRAPLNDARIFNNGKPVYFDSAPTINFQLFASFYSSLASFNTYIA